MPAQPPPNSLTDRHVPTDLGRWQRAADLAALLSGRYRFDVGDTARSLSGAATFRALTTPGEWRVVRVRTRGRGVRTEAWLRFQGRDSEGRLLEVARFYRRGG